MSRGSSAIHSPGRNPVAAAKSTAGPKRGPSRPASSSSCAHDSKGRFSVRRRCGLSTPCLAGLESIIPQTNARAGTCRSAWVASKRCPGEIVIRQAAISCERSPERRRPPKARSALASRSSSKTGRAQAASLQASRPLVRRPTAIRYCSARTPRSRSPRRRRRTCRLTSSSTLLSSHRSRKVRKRDISIDHIVPLALGGAHCLANVALAPSCPMTYSP